MKKQMAAAGMMMVMGMLMTGCGTKQINLNDYLTAADVTGYEGYGELEGGEIDYERLVYDIMDAAKVSDPESEKAYAIDLAVELGIDGSWDQTHNLSNGDTATFTWNVDEEALKEVGVKVTYSDEEIKAENLDKIGSFDAFADLTYEVTGTAPNAKLIVNNEKYPEIDYTVEPSDHLSNGDTVTISIEDSNTEAYIERYGAVPEAGETTYTVSGCDAYITSISQLTEEAKAQMEQEVDDYITAYYATSEAEVRNYNIIGYYLLNAKDENTYGDINELYLVYSTDLHWANEEASEDVTSYKYMRFDNVILYGDGELYVDLNNYTVPEGGWFATEYFSTSLNSYVGYESLDKLYNACVAANKADYTVDTDIQ